MKLHNFGLFLLRVTISGLMLYLHGLPKILNFSEKVEVFPDPLGIGPSNSLILCVFAEGICSLGLMLGFLTRFSAFCLSVNMFTAFYFVHQGDPWSIKELPFVYLIIFLSFMLTGAGRVSVDHKVFGKFKNNYRYTPSL